MTASTNTRAKHYRTWPTFGGDEIGNCPQCPDHYIGNVHINSHLVVTGRACRYCWTRFTPDRPTQFHCGPICADRDRQWDAWISATRAEGVYGRPGPAMPPAGAKLAASVARFELVLEEVAA